MTLDDLREYLEDFAWFWPGVLVSLGWVALLGAAGTWRTLRRDIT